MAWYTSRGRFWLSPAGARTLVSRRDRRREAQMRYVSMCPCIIFRIFAIYSFFYHVTYAYSMDMHMIWIWMCKYKYEIFRNRNINMILNMNIWISIIYIHDNYISSWYLMPKGMVICCCWCSLMRVPRMYLYMRAIFRNIHILNIHIHIDIGFWIYIYIYILILILILIIGYIYMIFTQW